MREIRGHIHRLTTSTHCLGILSRRQRGRSSVWECGRLTKRTNGGAHRKGQIGQADGLEHVDGFGDHAQASAAVDVQVPLTITGGRERSRSEYEKLLHGSGYRIDYVTAMPMDMNLLVATAT